MIVDKNKKISEMTIKEMEDIIQKQLVMAGPLFQIIGKELSDIKSLIISLVDNKTLYF